MSFATRAGEPRWTGPKGGVTQIQAHTCNTNTHLRQTRGLSVQVPTRTVPATCQGLALCRLRWCVLRKLGSSLAARDTVCLSIPNSYQAASYMFPHLILSHRLRWGFWSPLYRWGHLSRVTQSWDLNPGLWFCPSPSVFATWVGNNHKYNNTNSNNKAGLKA